MKYLATLLLLVVVSAAASAQHLLKEDFTAATSTALTAAGWTQSGSTTTNPLTIGSASGISLTGYAGSGVGNALPMANTGQDVYKAFNADSTGSIYLSFLLNVSAVQTGDYFIALSPATAQTNYYARLHLKTTTGGYAVGISKSSEVSGGAQYGSTVLSLGTTYLMVLKYTFAPGDSNDPIHVYVFSDSASAASEPSTSELAYTNTTKADAPNLGIVTIRQGSSTAAPTLTIDGLRIGTTWNDIIYSYYVRPAAIDFGAVNVGLNVEDSVLVTNYGTSAITVSPITPGDPTFAVTPIVNTVQPAETQKFTVTYTPAGAVANAATLSFVGSPSGSTDTVKVKGSGIQAGFLMSPASLTFGNVWKDSTVTDTVFVSNISTSAHLIIDSVVSSNSTFSVSPTSADLDTASADTFLVTFSPVAKGAEAGTLIFYSNAPTHHDTLKVSGNCITKEPGFLATPSPLDFHAVLVGKSKVDTITVKNDGYDSLFISNVTSTNSSFTVAPATARLDSMASKKFVVTFTPATAGVMAGALVFESNVTETKDTVMVSGVGSTVVTIAEARKDLNSDNIADHSVTGDTLFLRGVITSPNVQTPPQSGYFMQDSTAGIEIFSYDATPVDIVIGDSVFVIGTVAQYHGLVEFTPLKMDTVNFKLLKHNAVVPKAKLLTVSQFVTTPEAYEGSLIEIDTLYYSSGLWPAVGSNGSLFYKAKTGTDSVQIFVDKDTQVDGSTQPLDPVNFTGILSQYSSSSTVYDDGYELIPRDTSDIKHVIIDAISGRTSGIPKDFYLSQNYPNPFNPATTIEFGLPKESHVQIAVYNVLGQRVVLLVDGVMKAGNHRVAFNASRFASGVYFYVMRAGEKVFKQKMLLMK